MPSEHKSALDRQSPLSPAPLARTSQEVRGSSNATSPSLPHTLEHRGYTGTEEERSEAASRPALEGAADCAPLTAPDCVTADRLPLAPLPGAGAGLLHDLAAAQVVTLAELSAAGVVLLFVANFARPPSSAVNTYGLPSGSRTNEFSKCAPRERSFETTVH